MPLADWKMINCVIFPFFPSPKRGLPMLGNSYFDPSINRNILHLPSRLSSPASGTGDGCVCGIGSTANATAGYFLAAKHASTMMKVRFQGLNVCLCPSTPRSVREGGGGGGRGVCLSTKDSAPGAVSSSFPGDSPGWEGYAPAAT